MQTVQRSWTLTKTSWSVLRADKELLWLPVLSGLATLVTAAMFALPIFLTVDGSGDSASLSPLGWALVLLAYVSLAYVTIFFNAALVLAANERLQGGDPTVRSALAAAATRAGTILPWAVVSGTVSLVLRAIQERLGFVGRLIVGAIGIAWTLVTFLVLPILVIEGVGVGTAIKRSAELFKRTWGEQVVVSAGIGIVGVIASLAGLPALLLLLPGNVVLSVIGIGVFVLWVGVVTVVTSALSAVFQTALYRYAISGTPPAGFEAADLAGVFGPKK